MKKKGTVFGKAVGMVLAMTLICGVLYTIVVTGVSQLFFSDKANGSVIEIDGKKYGCELLAQEFTGEEYMWGRIMNVSAFTDQDGNTKMYSVPSILSPESQEYKELVEQRVEKIKEANPDADKEQIPEDLVTCSGSGLDPDISVAAAEYQVSRLAKANQMTEDEIQDIIDKCTNHKILGLFGEETVNVLRVNLMLEGIL
ncbi:MAG: potassium-transporting ATPase subunit KdpC [Schaedlerella sp.]|nr:potassium-transporting ATPase subunit KdpC [Lachnospiraceae bacterium]MDY4202541.1 potassium-transporting ATPase subunit KdpC [Schaedlerella sp.]